MSIVGFPLLLIPLAIYNIVVFLMQGVGFETPLARIALASGRAWTPTFSDGLIALGLLLLILEMIKAARPGAKYVTDHLLSFVVFAGAVAEFVMLPQFATSTFFLLTTLALVDFVASIGVRSRRERPARTRGKTRRSDEPSFEPAAASDLAAPADTRSTTTAKIEREPAVTPESPPMATMRRFQPMVHSPTRLPPRS